MRPCSVAIERLDTKTLEKHTQQRKSNSLMCIDRDGKRECEHFKILQAELKELNLRKDKILIPVKDQSADERNFGEIKNVIHNNKFEISNVKRVSSYSRLCDHCQERL